MLAAGAGGGYLDIFSLVVLFLFPFSLSLGDDLDSGLQSFLKVKITLTLREVILHYGN